MKITLRDLVNIAQARLLSGSPHGTFDHVSIDTRTLRRGDAFFALVGPHHDAHDHLAQANDLGASVVVVEKVDERLKFPGDHAPAMIQVSSTPKALQDLALWIRTRTSALVIGITGTNGKTTTKEMLASILRRRGKTLATRGNLNNHYGLPLMMTELDDSFRYVVLEMGASVEGDIALLARLARPQIGIITNIGKAHLLHLKSPEGVLQVKRALWDALPSDGTAIVNVDDPLLSALKSTLTCRTLTFGMEHAADVSASDVQTTSAGVSFQLTVHQEKLLVTLPVPGHFQIMNALAAAAAATAAGISTQEIVAGLEAFKPAPMRMQVLSHPSGALFVNDSYNANPTSVRAAVAGFCKTYENRSLWLVIGDMRELGPLCSQEHEALGEWLDTQPIEKIFLYGRDVRFVLQGTRHPERFVRFQKKRRLLSELQRSLQSNRAILFKGSRVMRLEQVVNALMVGSFDRIQR